MNVPTSDKAPNGPSNSFIESLALIGKRSSSVKSLSGFKKGHSIPDRANTSSQIFIAKLAEEELSADLNDVFKRMRSEFQFKRTQMIVSDSKDGTGSIATPWFSYSISIDHDSADPTSAVWRRAVEKITNSDAVFSEAFSEVFPNVFDTLELRTFSKVDIESLVDSLEELDDDRLELEYDHGLTECHVTIEGVPGEIHIDARTLRMVHSIPRLPSYMLRSFLAIQSALLSSNGVSMIPIDAL
jgi:hypothetical protein